MNGLVKKRIDGMVSTLYGNVMVAKGLISTLEFQEPEAFQKKLEAMEPQHLRILLLDLMEEILKMEHQTSILKNILTIKFI